jgi:hypothetical protein
MARLARVGRMGRMGLTGISRVDGGSRVTRLCGGGLRGTAELRLVGSLLGGGLPGAPWLCGASWLCGGGLSGVVGLPCVGCLTSDDMLGAPGLPRLSGLPWPDALPRVTGPPGATGFTRGGGLPGTVTSFGVPGFCRLSGLLRATGPFLLGLSARRRWTPGGGRPRGTDPVRPRLAVPPALGGGTVTCLPGVGIPPGRSHLRHAPTVRGDAESRMRGMRPVHHR